MIKKSFLLIFFLCFGLAACEQADMNKAIEYQKKGIYNKAIASYLSLIKKGKDVAQAHKNLADIYLEMGRLDSAFDSFRQSLNITPEFALDEVISLTSSGNKEVREHAIKTLIAVTNEDTKKAIFDALINKLKSTEFHDKVDSLETIFSFSKNASVLTDDILNIFDSEKPVIQNKILTNLDKIISDDNYSKIVDKLEQIAKNEEEKMLIRVAAVESIANIKSKRSFAKLIELTKENSTISASAKAAIDKIGLPSKEQIPELLPFLSDEQPSSVKIIVLKLFSGMNAQANDAVPNIILLLKDKNKTVKDTAKDALENIGIASQPALEGLIALLDNKDVDIKLRALNEIVEMNAVEQAIDNIKQLQQDSNKEVRKYAQQIIDNLKQ